MMVPTIAQKDGGSSPSTPKKAIMTKSLLSVPRQIWPPQTVASAQALQGTVKYHTLPSCKSSSSERRQRLIQTADASMPNYSYVETASVPAASIPSVVNQPSPYSAQQHSNQPPQAGASTNGRLSSRRTPSGPSSESAQKYSSRSQQQKLATTHSEQRSRLTTDGRASSAGAKRPSSPRVATNPQGIESTNVGSVNGVGTTRYYSPNKESLKRVLGRAQTRSIYEYVAAARDLKLPLTPEATMAYYRDLLADRDISSPQIRQLKENLDTNVHLAEDNMRQRTRCDALIEEVETLRRHLQAASEKGSQMSPEKPQAATAIFGATRQFPNTPQTSSTPRNNVRADAPEVPNSQSSELSNATPTFLQKSSASTQPPSVGRSYRMEVNHSTPANQKTLFLICIKDFERLNEKQLLRFRRQDLKEQFMHVERSLFKAVIHEESHAHFDRLSATGTAERMATKRSRVQPGSVVGRMTGYQLGGLSFLIWLYQNAANGILGDESGLGKTSQTLAFIAWLKEGGVRGSYLILCPAIEEAFWIEEITRWTPTLTSILYSGDSKERQRLRMQLGKMEPKPDICVVSYETFEADPFVKGLGWMYVILDRGEYINRDRGAWKALSRGLKSRFRLVLSSNLCEEDLWDVEALFNWLYPEIFTDVASKLLLGSWHALQRTFDPALKESSKALMGALMLRRTKDDVGTDMPPARRRVDPTPTLDYNTTSSRTEEEEEFFQRVREEQSSVIGNGAVWGWLWQSVVCVVDVLTGSLCD
ncbi:hypothetical protein HDV00_012133 [Rhizophlyctis rosea]|nr:hypothetical protein HDV00_012133 [Rhizophlyctis rosea]